MPPTNPNPKPMTKPPIVRKKLIMDRAMIVIPITEVLWIFLYPMIADMMISTPRTIPNAPRRKPA